MVYFAKRGTGRGPIKIGYSIQPEVRMRQLGRKVGEPVYLDSTLPGGMALEVRLHEMFAAGALGHEWFDYDTPGLHELTSDATHFEAFWPDDTESKGILRVLDLIVPNREDRAVYMTACKALRDQFPDDSLYWPDPADVLRESRLFLPELACP